MAEFRGELGEYADLSVSLAEQGAAQRQMLAWDWDDNGLGR